VLEDSGYYCVDNLPVQLLEQSAELLRGAGHARVAMSIDARTGDSLAQVPQTLAALKRGETDVRLLFLDATDATLVHRFSETRRRHPLARRGWDAAAPGEELTLEECLARERELLAPIGEIGQRIDTTDVHPNTLRRWIKSLLALDAAAATLLFESFSYKRGIPVDADLVFDVRCVPNPHYDPRLRPLTGLDAEVAAFLEREPQAGLLLADIRDFVETWLPAYAHDHRSALTVAIGCTGGRHRSVYFVERLGAYFRERSPKDVPVLVRHRHLDQA